MKKGCAGKSVRTLLAVLMAASVLFSGCSPAFKMTEKYSFIEIAETEFTPEKTAADNINAFLREKVYEDDSVFGFTAFSENVDLYKVNSLVELSALLKDTQNLELLKKKLAFLENSQISSMDFLNLLYYVNVCTKLGIPYNQAEVMKNIEKYYDKDANLFFINNPNDFEGMKLVATALCYNTLGKELEKYGFHLVQGARDAFKNYEFTTERSKTFYNSGGDILYCCSVLGLSQEINFSELTSWFHSWKDYYESLPVNSLESALAYSEFYNVARLFESNYSVEKLNGYYAGLKREEVSQADDLHALYNSIKNVSHLDNEEFNLAAGTAIAAAVGEGALFDSKLDVRETAFGVILARKTGFPVNDEKINRYIGRNYSAADETDSAEEKVDLLYYNLILEQAVNGYGIEYDRDFYQRELDDALKRIDFSSDTANGIAAARKIIEIAMDLQIHGANVTISMAQRAKIEAGLKKAVKDPEVLNSACVTDIYVIDSALSLNVVSEERFLEIYQALYQDGGSRMKQNADYPADIITTYQFVMCLERMSRFDNLEDQKAFVKTLRTGDGVYALYREEEPQFTMASVLYGNSLESLTFGGDKETAAK